MQPTQPSNCPSREALERFASGSTDEAVRLHVKSCPPCLRTVREIRDENALIREFAGPRGGEASVPGAAAEVPHLEGYEVLAQIHRGGQGVVYRAVQRSTKRVVAVKTLAPRSRIRARHRRRFEREIEVVAQLRHPHIVTLFDSAITQDGVHYFVMEYVPGSRLDEYLQRSGVLTIRTALELFSTICGAVQFAHQHGVIHRDLKPANILVDDNGAPHVLDFGLAKALGPEFSGGASSATHGGEFLGTLAYASPEQVRADPERIDTRTDVYALGVILYEMLTRQMPYPVEGSLSDVVYSITETEATKPSAVRRDIDGDLEAILLQALAKDPQRRYQSAAALLADLRHYLAGEPIDAKRDSTWYVLRKTLRRHRLGAGLAAAAVLVLAVFATTMFIQSRRLAGERNRLERTNRALRIGEARQAFLAGNYGVAEDALWRVYLADVAGASAAATGLDGGAGDIDAYWALWEFYSHQPCLRTTRAAVPAPLYCAASPDGRLLATCPLGGPLRIWDAPTGRLVETIAAEDASANLMNFLPNGRLLWNSGDGVLHLWDLVEGRMERQFATGPLKLDVSADGTLLLLSLVDVGARLMSCFDGQALADFGGSKGVISDARFVPGGDAIATLDVNGQVTLWRRADLSEQAEFAAPPGCSFPVNPLWQTWLRVRPDGREMAVADREQVGLLDPAVGVYSQVHNLRARIMELQYDPQGRWLASADSNGKLTLIPIAASAEPARTFHHRELRDVAWVASSDRIATTADDGALKLWEVNPNACLHSLPSSLTTIHSVSLNTSGDLLSLSGEVAGRSGHERGSPHSIEVWNLETNTRIGEFQGHAGTAACAAFGPAGGILASGGHDGTIRFWDLPSQRCLRTIAAHDLEISAIAFSPDGRYLASGGDDAKVKLWRVETGELVRTFSDHDSSVRVPWVCFSPDGTLLASCGASGARNSILLHDLTVQRSFELFHHLVAGTRALCFSPDGRILASGSDDRRIRLWDALTRSLVAEWEVPPFDIFSLSFHPKGRILASAGRGSDITLWDTLHPGAPYLAALRGNGTMVFSVRFHSDGRRLVSGGAGGTARIWDLAYYDRHIAGNGPYQAGRRRPRLSDRRVAGLTEGVRRR